jgi:hypothetical protein
LRSHGLHSGERIFNPRECQTSRAKAVEGSRANLLDAMMGAPGPRFPAKFSGFRALYAPFPYRKAHTQFCPVPRTGNSGGLDFETRDPSRKCRQTNLESFNQIEFSRFRRRKSDHLG